MVRIIQLLLLSCICGLSSYAQSERSWKVNSAFSFSTGFLTENTRTIQLHGYLGVHNKNLHIRGDGFYYLNAFGDRPRFDMNHQLYMGAFYHFFSDKQLQPYAGFQPGIAISRSSEYQTLDEETNQLQSKISANPLGSFAGGIHLYGEKFFFLFLEGRYIFGKHKSDAYPVYLDEFRISFGLGLTI